MTIKSYIPFAGKKSVRKKLNELEDNTPTLPVIFATLVMKIFESIVSFNVYKAIAFTLASLFVAVAHVYRVEAKKAIEEGKEKAEEVIEEKKSGEE